MAVAATDSLLSAFHHPLHTPFVPFHTHLLGVCPSGHREARTFQGTRTGRVAYPALQSLGRQRIRPCAVIL